MAGKILISLSRRLGNQGTDFPGRVARKIYPGILKELAANIEEEIFIVTGTNGKTTTSNMIAAILKEKGYSLVHNSAGANMLTGVTTAFIQASDIWGRNSFDYALLEVDEAYVPLLIKETRPRVVIITNFFRDQLDRYGELDHTINLIKDGVRNTEIELVLNGDDPLITHFQHDTGLHCWYYGFENTIYDSLESEESREGRYCVFCGEELEYSRYHYAQLGQFNCPRCRNQNPRLNFTGRGLKMTPFIQMKVNDLAISSPYQGFYNAYNILAAVSAARLVGIEDHIIQKAIAGYQPRAGRMENFIINGKRAVLILVKNPTGLNQTLSTLLYDQQSKNLFMALNDNGRQIINRGQRAKYLIENNHPAIIDRKDWEAAQQIRESRRKKAYPLSSMLRCPFCGASLTRVVHERRWVSWICATYLRKGKAKCPGMRIADGVLQEIVKDTPVTEPVVVEGVIYGKGRKKRSQEDFRLIPAAQYGGFKRNRE